MRTCIRCSSEMLENLILYTNDGMTTRIGEKGLFKGSLGKVRAAACPKCGWVETYVDNTEKLKRAMEKAREKF